MFKMRRHNNDVTPHAIAVTPSRVQRPVKKPRRIQTPSFTPVDNKSGAQKTAAGKDKNARSRCRNKELGKKRLSFSGSREQMIIETMGSASPYKNSFCLETEITSIQSASEETVIPVCNQEFPASHCKLSSCSTNAEPERVKVKPASVSHSSKKNTSSMNGNVVWQQDMNGSSPLNSTGNSFISPQTPNCKRRIFAEQLVSDFTLKEAAKNKRNKNMKKILVKKKIVEDNARNTVSQNNRNNSENKENLQTDLDDSGKVVRHLSTSEKLREMPKTNAEEKELLLQTRIRKSARKRQKVNQMAWHSPLDTRELLYNLAGTPASFMPPPSLGAPRKSKRCVYRRASPCCRRSLTKHFQNLQITSDCMDTPPGSPHDRIIP